MTIKADDRKAMNGQEKDARKERQSADMKSTYKAPPKKDGHGGGYTWDGPDNFADEGGFIAHDPQTEAAKLTATASGESGRIEDGDLFQLRQADFPALGGTSGRAPDSPARRANQKEWERNVAIDKDLAI